MEFEYMNKLSALLETAAEANKDKIKELSELFAENMMNDKIIHTFGTGHSHMIGIELFGRAGGLGNVNALLDPDTLTSFGAQRSSAIEKLPGLSDIIYDNYNIQPGDIMIVSSNSGRNSMPIECVVKKKVSMLSLLLTLLSLVQQQAVILAEKNYMNLQI